jgi:dihydroorotate dehydrogenase (NAD+) catalytic subunit
MADMTIDFLGMHFRNPVLPAAGPNVRDGESLRLAAEGGAGGLLAKTVSVEAAPVPRTHMMKFGQQGMLNTELWTELTLEEWLDKEYAIGIAAAREHGVPFIASMGYTAEELRVVGPKVAAIDGIDAVEVTIHYTGGAEKVEAGVIALREVIDLPIIAKLSPHYGDLGDLAAQLEPHVDAFTCINSFGPTLAIDIETAKPVLGSQFGYGWISGEPLKPLALRCVFEVSRRVSKPVMGVGGISSGRDLIEHFMAGASAVGICTAVMYEGHEIYGKIAREASEWLDEHGYASIRDVQGLFLKNIGEGQEVVIETRMQPRVVEDLCIKCTACERVCMFDAITAPPGELAKVHEDKCFQCGLCLTVCPTGALVWPEGEGLGGH